MATIVLFTAEQEFRFVHLNKASHKRLIYDVNAQAGSKGLMKWPL